jgi:hypothetical protein
VSENGADAGRAAAQPEERKTETTLTTRIRINIPGSRPIPPVVVRKPVAGGDTDSEGGGGRPATASSNRSDGPAQSFPASGGPDGRSHEAAGAGADGAGDGLGGDGRTPAGGPAAGPGTGGTSGGETGAPAGEKPTSDWFAPRKSAAGRGGQGGAPANGVAAGGGSGAPASGAGATGSGAGPAGGDLPGGARPGGGGRPGGVVGSMSVPGGPAGSARTGSAGGAGLAGATGGPVAPGHGGGTGSFDVTEALAAGPLSGGSRPDDSAEPHRGELPFFTEGGQGGQGGQDAPGGQSRPGVPGGQSGPGVPGGYNGTGVPGGPGGPHEPAGPTSGPVTGDGPLHPPAGGTPGAHTAHSAHTAHPGSLSDDTAILTPQRPAPEPGAPGRANRPDNVSGHTVTSGMRVLQPGNDPAVQQADGSDRPQPHVPPKLPDPPAQNTTASKSAKAAKKKGRSKSALLIGAVIVVGGLAYGAGLLMNRSDVPKGTTVLGVDIGGGTRDEAVKKLDDAFGKRVGQPLKLSVDGKTVALKPDQAGLQFDTQATASAAAQSDYNPVSVIGSLFGNHRVVQPRMPVDEEKLQAALQNAAGGAGSVVEGTIRFEPGKAVAVYGKAGKGIDAANSTRAVEQAYRTQVETGTTTPVRVPTTVRQPTVSDAAVDGAMKKFAEPAMSGFVTVKAGVHSVQMSPQKSLWKFLGVTAVDGKLVDKPDLDALKQLYGSTFDGVLITRAGGEKTQVTPQEVYIALRQALMSRTNRVAVIDTNPS